MDLMKSTFLIVFLCSVFAACTVTEKSPKKNETDPASPQAGVPGPRCIIYKTRNDYRNKVPVTLSRDRSVIVSYPDIRDIRTKDGFSLPGLLADGYLLDNRGIGPDVAFLSLTYEGYAALQKTPQAGELFREIIDKDPLTEMYDCGNRGRYTDVVKELNDIILAGKLNQFKKLK